MDEAVQALVKEASKDSEMSPKERSGFTAWLRAQAQAIDDAIKARKEYFDRMTEELYGIDQLPITTHGLLFPPPTSSSTSY